MAARMARGFTLLELMLSLVIVCALLVILLPALSSARVSSHRALCAGNQRVLGLAWASWLDSNEGRFPVLYERPAWMYGGVRFSSIDDGPFLDLNRPLSRHVPVQRLDVPGELIFQCPADRGITDEHGGVGTGRRTAYEAFGTSYRANDRLLSPPGRGLKRDAITTAASRLVVLGDAFWYEVREDTGRLAAWHGPRDAGNLLFLDGSVRFVPVAPKPKIGAVVFDPMAPDLVFPVPAP